MGQEFHGSKIQCNKCKREYVDNMSREETLTSAKRKRYGCNSEGEKIGPIRFCRYMYVM